MEIFMMTPALQKHTPQEIIMTLKSMVAQ